MNAARRVVALLLLLVGMGVMLYPVVGTLLNEQSFSNAVDHYEEKMGMLSDDEREAMLAEAHAYNDSLRGDPVRDPFIPHSGFALPDNYESVLDVDGEGLMGTVSIPVIGVELPIRHGVSDGVLEQGVGHIPQTSLPVGGEGTHSVLTSHTGLPTARLFTDLAMLKKGDVFIIDMLGEKRAYAVDDITVIEPSDLSAVRIDSEHDYVTLLTCTPYGLNTHRLLVRGAPCALPEAGKLVDMRVPLQMEMLVWGIAFLSLSAIITAALRIHRMRKRR
ncbi:MAG: class C sortase [Gordonibacter sp.]|uniref:class C sortase n=1 Tax=Gordonibacter sp. TaxID=1968902 RepID=UPI002FC7562F